MTEQAQEWRLARRPDGYPVPADVELVDVPAPEPQPGEVLVRNAFISVDPYMRGRMNEAASYAASYRLGEAMWGGAVGHVVASADDRFPVGAAVRHAKGWRTHAAVRTDELEVVDGSAAPLTAYLGVLGMPGLTAWVGLLDIAEVRPGETVWVSAASGAVGSLVGQLAKQIGCTVIGSAGGPGKATALVDDLGFDAGIDYRAGDLPGQLAAAAPDGIDVYFDNVGGDHLQAALTSLRPFGRVAACGRIADYNETRPGPDNLALVVSKSLTIRGFIVSNHMSRTAAFERHVAGLLRSGTIVYPETVVRGLDRGFEAFVGMLRGGNHTGKLVVDVT
ncbi:MAG: Putative oxidoreductase YncB [uncultured Blastococcus sp.]|uniref:Oxidoreductase YncB n=1 Tax=uncultured Blastococcus sp. TaxID=217144 RepID=A0A6J4HW16_9ACTN|nr:MAG: Putative oxidoreductase YncB [uncultured Blastococcus sp.]